MSMGVCFCVCVCVCLQVCAYVGVSSVHMCAYHQCMHVCKCVYVHLCMFVQIRVNEYVVMCVSICA